MIKETAPNRYTVATRSTLVSVFVNSLLSTIQIIIGFFSHSQSLIADGFHTLTDLFADFIVLGANRISRSKADANHPYGHARFETVASMVLGLLLIIAGLGMLFVAARKFADPSSIPRVHQIALYVAVVVVISKEILFRYMVRVAKRMNSTMLMANAWHARADAASSVVVAFGIFGNLMGYVFLDPLAAALVGFMICRTGGKFAWNALSRLADGGLPPQELQAIEKTLKETPGVINIHNVRTRYMGDSVLVDAHLLVNSELTVSEAHLIAVNARKRVIAEHHALDALMHIDPEDDRDEDDNNFPDLPGRDEIVAALGDIYAQFQPDLHIHYLHGEINLILLLEKQQLDDDNHRKRIVEQLMSLKKRYPMLKSVRLITTIEQINF